MNADFGTGVNRLLLPVGTAYLVYLALQPPPAKWVGLGCLAIVGPLLVGWLAGAVAGVGPWADDD
ncbi:hypothetical protein [Halobacterium litoreum]|uniref:Uncharacterized protein n=1 Tax=Halobacterium litoreum TaxID=2039234 RepID=A0ABD5NFY6_9EURY|nr:hypothetical protein [Halobacterium litoreum]UHH13004.1 hypothetical protein LT972_12680 [Halobacterium litoreum]